MPLKEFVDKTIKDLSPFLADNSSIEFDVPTAIDKYGNIVIRSDGGRTKFKVRFLRDMNINTQEVYNQD